MEPLELSTRPPRSGLEKLGGLYLLARTIDKIPAHLPDGNPGEYKILGFSERLLQALGVSEYDLRAATRIQKRQTPRNGRRESKTFALFVIRKTGRKSNNTTSGS